MLKVDSGAVTTYAYNVADELLLVTPPSGQPTTSTWDADGNLRTENAGGQVTTYAWNPDNRLTSVVNPDATTEAYVYQANGLGQKRTNADGTTLFLWDEQNLLMETDASLVMQARYTGWPAYLGGLATMRRSGVTSIFGFDPQRSTRLLLSTDASVTDRYGYNAFGLELWRLGNTQNENQFVGALGYRRDNTFRYVVGVRNVDVGVGRWIARLPGPEGEILSAYSYVGNNPSGFAAPSGGMQSLTPNPWGFWQCWNFYCQMWSGRYIIGPSTCEMCRRQHGMHVDCKSDYFTHGCKADPRKPPGPTIPCWIPEDLTACIAACKAACLAAGKGAGAALCKKACRSICTKLTGPVCDMLWDECERFVAVRNYVYGNICYDYYFSIPDCAEGKVRPTIP